MTCDCVPSCPSKQPRARCWGPWFGRSSPGCHAEMSKEVPLLRARPVSASRAQRLPAALEATSELSDASPAALRQPYRPAEAQSWSSAPPRSQPQGVPFCRQPISVDKDAISKELRDEAEAFRNRRLLLAVWRPWRFAALATSRRLRRTARLVHTLHLGRLLRAWQEEAERLAAHTEEQRLLTFVEKSRQVQSERFVREQMQQLQQEAAVHSLRRKWALLAASAVLTVWSISCRLSRVERRSSARWSKVLLRSGFVELATASRLATAERRLAAAAARRWLHRCFHAYLARTQATAALRARAAAAHRLLQARKMQQTIATWHNGAGQLARLRYNAATAKATLCHRRKASAFRRLWTQSRQGAAIASAEHTMEMQRTKAALLQLRGLLERKQRIARLTTSCREHRQAGALRRWRTAQQGKSKAKQQLRSAFLVWAFARRQARRQGELRKTFLSAWREAVTRGRRARDKAVRAAWATEAAEMMVCQRLLRLLPMAFAEWAAPLVGARSLKVKVAQRSRLRLLQQCLHAVHSLIAHQKAAQRLAQALEVCRHMCLAVPMRRWRLESRAAGLAGAHDRRLCALALRGFMAHTQQLQAARQLWEAKARLSTSTAWQHWRLAAEELRSGEAAASERLIQRRRAEAVARWRTWREEVTAKRCRLQTLPSVFRAWRRTSKVERFSRRVQRRWGLRHWRWAIRGRWTDRRRQVLACLHAGRRKLRIAMLHWQIFVWWCRTDSEWPGEQNGRKAEDSSSRLVDCWAEAVGATEALWPLVALQKRPSEA